MYTAGRGFLLLDLLGTGNQKAFLITYVIGFGYMLCKSIITVIEVLEFVGLSSNVSPTVRILGCKMLRAVVWGCGGGGEVGTIFGVKCACFGQM